MRRHFRPRRSVAGVSGSVSRLRKVCVNATGDGVEDRKVDSVAVGVSCDDEIVLLRSWSLRLPSASAAIVVGIGLGRSHVSRQHCEGSRLIGGQARRSGQGKWAKPVSAIEKGHVNCRARANVASILGSHPGSLIPA